jgi:hypothetical protein
MEDPRGYIGCYNNRQAGYTSCVSGHSKCMVSTAENPPVFSVSHSHARDAPPLLKETVALLSRWRVSRDLLSMKKSLLLSSIHLFPEQKAHSAGSSGRLHLPWCGAAAAPMIVLLQTFPLLLLHDMKKTQPCESNFAKKVLIRKPNLHGCC